MVIRLGFTGSQDGMTILQREKLIKIFEEQEAEDIIIHLGDCIGADEEAYGLAKEKDFITVGHPPIKHLKRAYCEYDYEEGVKSYLERNKDIVNSCDILIATPKQYFNVTRSGTWYTIRYAEGKIPTLIINPDGSMPKSLLLNWLMNRRNNVS